MKDKSCGLPWIRSCYVYYCLVASHIINIYYYYSVLIFNMFRSVTVISVAFYYILVKKKLLKTNPYRCL